MEIGERKGDIRERKGKNKREGTLEAVNVSKDPRDYCFQSRCCNTYVGCKSNGMNGGQDFFKPNKIK